MTAYINALSRGGFSAYGSAHYDERRNVVVIAGTEGETVLADAAFPSAISTVDITNYGGITSTDPTISDDSMTFTLSNFNDGAKLRYDVMLTSGEVRHLNVEIGMRAAMSTITDTGGDYGDFIP